jgi:hypothetical protein
MGNSINKSNDASMPSTPILVLGMHRSGTSAVARVIAALGAYPGAPGELLPAHAKDNPAGYWERTDLVIEHDRFLASVGYAWDRVAGFDPTALDRERVGALHKALRPIIDSLQGNGTPWLVKDPRLSILLPLWLPLIDSAACVVVVRDPREIAASLRRADQPVSLAAVGKISALSIARFTGAARAFRFLCGAACRRANANYATAARA